VLVVDDDADIRIALRAVLETAGYDVSAARDGTHALLQLGLGGETPSLIILDLAMPGLDGVELMEALGAFKTTDKPQVIVYSAYLSDANSTRATELGARAVLSKPLLPAQLLEVVQGCLENREFPAASNSRSSGFGQNSA
jgi:CheY-like chemotaxis protein